MRIILLKEKLFFMKFSHCSFYICSLQILTTQKSRKGKKYIHEIFISKTWSRCSFVFYCEYYEFQFPLHHIIQNGCRSLYFDTFSMVTKNHIGSNVKNFNAVANANPCQNVAHTLATKDNIRIELYLFVVQFPAQ